MKKLILITFVFLFSCSFIYAENSRNFSFIWSLVDSLHSLDWGSSYEVTEGDDLTQMLTKFMNQNNKYEMAIGTMNKHLKEKDEYMSMVAKGIVGGALAW